MVNKLWEMISTSGLTPYLDHNQKKLVRIVNQIIVLAFFVASIFAIVDAYYGYYWLSLFSFGTAFIYILIFFIHRKGYINFSRFLLITNTLVNILFFSSIHGQDHGSHYFLIPVLMGIFAIFSNKEQIRLLISVLLVFLSWIALEATEYRALAYLQPATEVAGWVNMLHYGLTLVTTMVIMIYFTRETTLSEQEVEKNREHLKSVINSTDNGIWLLDRNYTLLIFNNTFADWCREFFGKSLYPGDNIINQFNPESAIKTEFKERYDAVFNSGEMQTWEQYYELGKYKVCLEIVLNPVWIDGKIIALSGFARDMTERKKIETELNIAKEQAEEASRAKSMFLSNLSHELRTPLNAIYGLTQLVYSTNIDDKHNQNLKTILESTENLTGLIDNLLDFSDIKDGKLTFREDRFSLKKGLEEAVSSFEQTALQKEISLYYLTPNNLPDYVIGDASRFNQVLSILIDNAIKFTAQGSVSIELQLSSAKGDDLTIQVTVKDTGPGISEEAKASLFESFSQADNKDTRQYGGAGMGLPIAKKLVEAQGGSINWSSTPGKGSEFIVELPLKSAVKQKSADNSETTTKEETTDLKQKHILVVDDNDINRLMANQVLKQLSFDQISLAEGGEQALEIFGQKPPDAILLDIQMPEMDGYEVAMQIRQYENGKDLPIIAVSADIIPETKEKAKASGMDDFIEKPLKVEVLKKVLGKYLKQ